MVRIPTFGLITAIHRSCQTGPSSACSFLIDAASFGLFLQWLDISTQTYRVGIRINSYSTYFFNLRIPVLIEFHHVLKGLVLLIAVERFAFTSSSSLTHIPWTCSWIRQYSREFVYISVCTEVLPRVVLCILWAALIKYSILSIVGYSEVLAHVFFLVSLCLPADVVIEPVHVLLTHSFFLIVFSYQICEVHLLITRLLIVSTSTPVPWAWQGHTFKFIVSFLTAIVVCSHLLYR